MNRSLLDILRCPACRGVVALLEDAADPLTTGTLRCQICLKTYSIVNGIPRFVPAVNYASNFGFQWNRFDRTQLDSVSGVPISRTRFFDETGWRAEELRGRLVLDAGCGAGRFAEVALSCGARVVAIDYSTAVEACRRNLPQSGDIDIVQADIYALPFAPAQFDFVYSLGVLQHTPDVRRAVRALPDQLAPGGRLAVDFYLLNAAHWVHPRTWLRPITTRISPERLFPIVERSVPALLALSRAVGRVPIVGRLLKRFVPVANYEGVFGLSDAQLEQWAVLDTFDWLGARYEHPQRPATVKQWLFEAGLDEVQVFRSHHLVGRGVRSSYAAA